MLRMISELWNWAGAEADRLHNLLMKAFLSVMVLLLVMWGINHAGYEIVNLIAAPILAIYLAWRLLNPRLIGIAGGAGALIEALWDSDKSQGVAKGFILYGRIVIALILAFLLVAVPLGTLSLQGSPRTFWYLLAGGMLVGVSVLFLEIKGKTLGWIGLAYGLGVVIVGALLRPADGKTVTGYNWAETQIGTLLGQFIPGGYVNLVVWGLIALAVWLVVRHFRDNTGTKAKATKSGGGFLTILLVAALVIATGMIGYKWSGNVAPVIADLVFYDKMTIEVPMEPKGVVVKVSLPAPMREMYNTPRNYYFCAKPTAPALESALGPVNGLQELPYGNPRSYEKKVELHPLLRDLAEQNSIKTVKLRIWRIERRWDERPNCS